MFCEPKARRNMEVELIPRAKRFGIKSEKWEMHGMAGGAPGSGESF